MKNFERREQVSRAIQRELALLIQSGAVKDDRLPPMVSIVDVALNSSLSSARISFSILGAQADEFMYIGAQAALREAAGYLRGQVGSTLNLRYAPKFYFEPCTNLVETVDLVHLIDKTVEADEEVHDE